MCTCFVFAPGYNYCDSENGPEMELKWKLSEKTKKQSELGLFLLSVMAWRLWPLTSSLLSEAHFLFIHVDKNACNIKKTILHLHPFCTIESHLISDSDVQASHPKCTSPSTSTGRQPPAHISVDLFSLWEAKSLSEYPGRGSSDY